MFHPTLGSSAGQVTETLTSDKVKKSASPGRNMLDKVFSGFVSRAGGGWSGELIIAESEDLQSTSTFEVCATRFKYQEVSAGTLSVRV